MLGYAFLQKKMFDGASFYNQAAFVNIIVQLAYPQFSQHRRKFPTFLASASQPVPWTLIKTRMIRNFICLLKRRFWPAESSDQHHLGVGALEVLSGTS